MEEVTVNYLNKEITTIISDKSIKANSEWCAKLTMIYSDSWQKITFETGLNQVQNLPQF